MRGKPLFSALGGNNSRITPAYAGKTPNILPLKRKLGDHPRVCGENLGCVCTNDLKKGSPPRMRGKPLIQLTFILPPGITPAYAGKTHRHNVAQCIIRDHPRVCGENRNVSPDTALMAGSPPRMRGKQGCYSSLKFFFGITPAYAGKTRLKPSNSPQRWDHPRVCGENCQPRISCLHSARITPAYAGKTADMTKEQVLQEDHPRVCGENAFPLLPFSL